MSASADYKPAAFLSITPLRPSEIPPEPTIIAEGKRLIAASEAWKAGKTFFHVVKTSSRPKGPGEAAPWYCRWSVHSPGEITFDQLWEKLSRNKAENELQFIHEIQKVNQVKELSPTAKIWTLYYTFTPPVSARVFTELQVVFLETSSQSDSPSESSDPNSNANANANANSNKPLRTGYIVSLPIDLTGPGDEELAVLEEKGVKGRYVSVERVMELANGDTEWRMATASTPGGSIPNFIVESTMAKKISSDVPQFLKWFQSKK